MFRFTFYRNLNVTKINSYLNQYRLFSVNIEDFAIDKIRNFCIIAHVDHGKSTLADRLLEMTGTILKKNNNKQVLDKLQVERERGITVKAQSATLVYKYKNNNFLLNLIDTPGHVDFNYEVSRSLKPCQGCILLVDANQGVQAQTVANYYLALQAGLKIIPVLNKIDLKGAKPEIVLEQMQNIFSIAADSVLKVSAKHGTNVESVLEAIVERISPPNHCIRDHKFRGLLYDSAYDKYKGTECSIAVYDGCIKKGEKIQSTLTKKTYQITEIGILFPDHLQTNILLAGQVGYMYANIKKSTEALIGDTFFKVGDIIEPLTGFNAAKPMVFAGVYPIDQSQHLSLKNSLEKLTLNDQSVSIQTDSSNALGQGWRIGFLGLLHMDVFRQRLEQEYNTNIIITTPTVPYKIKTTKNKEIIIKNPNEIDKHGIKEFYEPIVKARIVTPDDYLSKITELLVEKRARNFEQLYLDNKRLICNFIIPLNEIVVDFYDILKSVSSGYASFDYDDLQYEISNLVKIEILINDKIVGELSQITHATKSLEKAKKILQSLKVHLPRQLFQVVIQARINNKIMARQEIKALRKDVTAKLYGGDITRRMKLLQRQKEGKERLKAIGGISISSDVFVEVLKEVK